MRITAFSLFFASIFAAAPAYATPPQVISVDETILSIGGSFLFIRRELTDNLGDRQGQLTDVVLIARSQETNQDVYLWPIKRTLDNGPEHVETPDNPRVVALPLDQDHNPWQIAYYHHGGLPNERKATDEDGIELLANKDGVLISAKTPDFFYETPEGTPPRTSYWLSYAKLSDLFRFSLMNTRYGFQPYYVMDGDPLTGVEFNPEQDCNFDFFAELSEQTDGEQQAFWAAKVTCENEVTMAPVSMFITLQPLP
ncbi:MAG: hypothetical protein KAT26_07175 [Marinosulfonomonas sp.]|nr:hypothetical protein [Marinosulfonomonas sp.]